MVRVTGGGVAALPMCHPSVITSLKLGRNHGGNALKSQDYRKGFGELPLNWVECASFRTLSGTYAMMERRKRTEAQHQARRTRGGLCRGPGSGDRLAAPAGPHDLSGSPAAVSVG